MTLYFKGRNSLKTTTYKQKNYRHHKDTIKCGFSQLFTIMNIETFRVF